MSTAHFLSPLRYPGGKRKLGAFVAEVVDAQQSRPRRYVEPFAGGAGVGLHLLVHGHVEEVVLNDLDPGIAAFWRAVFTRPEDLVKRIRRSNPTLRTWHGHRKRYLEASGDDVELGFSTFFLNRTNRSGILGARPIGGLEQTGKWALGARYNASDLVTRIRRLASFADRVSVTEEDGIALTERYLDDSEAFLYIDPPYLAKSEDLYLDTLTMPDHRRLATLLLTRPRWMVTYDKDPRVLRLYPRLRCATFGIAHTAQVQHVGNEYAVFAEGLALPPLDRLGRGDAKFVPRRRS